jgi:hypothetical protein
MPWACSSPLSATLHVVRTGLASNNLDFGIGYLVSRINGHQAVSISTATARAINQLRTGYSPFCGGESVRITLKLRGLFIYSPSTQGGRAKQD